MGSTDFILIPASSWPGIGTHSFTVSTPWGECIAFSAAIAIHTLPIFVPPGTHYSWVDRGGVNSKLPQGLYIWPVIQKSNPRPLDLSSNELTTRSLAPQISYKNFANTHKRQNLLTRISIPTDTARNWSLIFLQLKLIFNQHRHHIGTVNVSYIWFYGSLYSGRNYLGALWNLRVVS